MNENHFRPIKDVNDNHTTISVNQTWEYNTTSDSSDVPIEQQHQRSLTMK